MTAACAVTIDDPVEKNQDPTPVAETQTGTVKQAATEDIYATLGVDRPDVRDFIFSDVPDPWPASTVEACVAYDTTVPMQRACLCADPTCMDLMHQCDALDGCKEIRACASRIGCTDAYSCYLAPIAPDCVEPIDRWGNSGFAVALTNLIGDCVARLGCPTTAQ